MNLSDALTESEDRRHHGLGLVSHGLRGAVVRTRDDLESLAARWEGLERFSKGANFYQSLGWARAIFDFEAARGNARFDPVIATIEDGKRLVGVLAMERVRTGARTLLVPLGHAFSQVSDVLLDADVDPAIAVARLLRVAIDQAPSDGVSFLKVRSDSALALGMPRTHVRTGQEQGAPYVALDGYPDFASYFATIRTKTRKNMRNARNRLEREGPVDYRVVTDPVEQMALIERTLGGRADRLKAQGLTSRAFSDGGFFAFCKSLVDRGDMTILAFSMQHGDRPLAEQWGFVHGGRYYAFVASRDFSHSDESPGKLLLSEIIRICSDKGIKGCDLGVPVMPYKLTFATQVVTLNDYALPITPRGWAVIQLWDVLLRPALKRLALAMPAWLRARLVRAAGRPCRTAEDAASPQG